MVGNGRSLLVEQQTKTTHPFILASFISLPKMGVSAAALYQRKVKKLDRNMIKIFNFSIDHLEKAKSNSQPYFSIQRFYTNKGLNIPFNSVRKMVLRIVYTYLVLRI